MRRLLNVAAEPHPHEALVALLSVLVGAFSAVAPDRISPAIADSFPGHTERWYFAGLAVAGLFVLASLALRYRAAGMTVGRVIDRLSIERIGLVVLTLAYLVYVVALLGNSGLRGTLAALTPACFVGANVVRLVQIHRGIRLLTAYAVDHEGE